MSKWDIYKTKTFSKEIKRYIKNKDFLNEFEKIFKKLKINPLLVGKRLSGNLHPSKSVRITSYLRLIFLIDKNKKIVYLEAIDNRSKVYKK